jgi:uncharacterized protein YndB with AHSA1/START domain
VWAAWTEPAHVVKWFTPAPWTTTRCEIELYPGGRFFTVMKSPDGDEMPGTGCYLEVEPLRRLTWTSALVGGFRPAPPATGPGSFRFTATIELAAHGAGTRYTATARHADAAARAEHDAMQFHAGWGKALDQLVAHMKTAR